MSTNEIGHDSELAYTPSAGQKAARVAVDLPVWKTFFYRIPEGLSMEMVMGRRVRIPFGKRKVTGYVIGAVADHGIRELKDILEILDPEPVFPESMVPLFEWVSEYYVCPLGIVMSALLPPGLAVVTHRFASITEKGLAALEGNSTMSELMEILTWVRKNPGKKFPWPASKASRLKSREWINLEEHHSQRKGASPLMRNFVRLKPDIDASGIFESKALSQQPPRERDFLQYIFNAGPVLLSDLRSRFQGADYLTNKWASKGVVEKCMFPVCRRPVAGIVSQYPRPLELFPQQARSVEHIVSLIDKGGFACCLLYGVTGSGKTEIYFRTAEAAIASGKQVLIMVPEISLAAYMEGVFIARMGEKTAVYHSGLSDGERYDQWMRMSRGEVDLVIGARSALFSPLERLGLIIVDEEHDPAYKQDSNPRYQARDTAVMRAKLENAVVVLGSGTPSVQSFHNTITGKYHLLSMPERVESRPLPDVEIVDMKDVQDNPGEAPMLSPRLLEAIEETLHMGNQSLLFLNRRGYHRLFLCRVCGQILKCPNCDVALAFHFREQHLICHYCGFASSRASRCSGCGCEGFKAYGFGTEKLEQELSTHFPSAKTARMDADSTRRKGQALQLLKLFARREIDILVGTQMITKGFDFPAVTLVGVIAADLSLAFPDFRSAERTFQLLSQVAGRAGRGEKPGKVIIQTFNPSHYSLHLAVAHDFKAFSTKESELRASLGYPPFRHIAVLRFQGNRKKETSDAATCIAGIIRRHTSGLPHEAGDFRIMGPVEAPIAKLKGRYRFQIMLKAMHPFLIQRILKAAMPEAKSLLDKCGAECIVDVDPYHML
ncbi:MAG: primosomal protein N' [Desulfobacteraceae bacterium]|nr:MAG: primosomal protein N' [Desulfobacteraceae bacterium]